MGVSFGVCLCHPSSPSVLNANATHLCYLLRVLLAPCSFMDRTVHMSFSFVSVSKAYPILVEFCSDWLCALACQSRFDPFDTEGKDSPAHLPELDDMSWGQCWYPGSMCDVCSGCNCGHKCADSSLATWLKYQCPYLEGITLGE